MPVIRPLTCESAAGALSVEIEMEPGSGMLDESPYFEPEIETMPREEIEARQFDALG
jgi:hypothetical protein